MEEVRLACLTMGQQYQTRRVKIGESLDLKRGEAVEIKTAGNGAALDEIQALTDAAKLEGYLLHSYKTEAGETCEADVIYIAPHGLARSKVTFPAGAVADLVNITDRIPLLDAINEQGVL